MIMLDTHVLVWWVSGHYKLSKKAKTAVEKGIDKKEEILISSISIWEIFLLAKKERIDFNIDVTVWLSRVERLPYFQFVPVNNSIAALSVMLPEPFHSDPADRIIVATAKDKGATLVTSDNKIQKYPEVKTLW